MTPAGITVPGDSTGAPATLVASLEGRNEVTAGAPQAQALELIGIQGNTLSYSVSWRGIGTPTEADIHAGGRGVDGPVVVPLFTTPRQGGGFASGTVTVTDPTLLDALRSTRVASTPTCTPPSSPTARRGPSSTCSTTRSAPAAWPRCRSRWSSAARSTPAPRRPTARSRSPNTTSTRTSPAASTTPSCEPLAGTPQWQAPDGSAVSGKLVTKNANGAGNIAELNLDATQIGTSTGLLAHAVEVLRLNTVGGVAPTGTCDPQATPIVNVPYQADYLFING